ncbi:MAG TPA: class I tRNA ligase family protein [Candidatus Paceibacterota bacterium]|nr:class I tRNA ligase family protein [Candidatus Paceibacterota bacterium]
MSSIELPKAYDPAATEDHIYQRWTDSGFFNPDNLPGERTKNFVTAIAPPNITGELHMGHALETSLEDILVRMRRMQGYRVLYLPGTDHAGIAAQNKVEKQLAKEGTTRQKLGREKFLERMWEWKEKYGGIILSQFRKLGLSLDWSRSRFTMDPAYQKAVETAFKEYHSRGWIYQGERVVNWCARCATSISDLEVNYVPEKTKLYYITYGPFTLATTRPETKLGDTALAVHPDDDRYRQYVGQELEIESVDPSVPQDQPPLKKTIRITVVADEAVDPKFGTGIVKVTPAHDVTDSEIAQRHALPSVTIIDEHGRMNDNAGVRYAGMKVAQAREHIVHDLEQLGLLPKTEEYEHNIGRCDRCDSVIEPLPSKQWFLKMSELAKLALEALDREEVRVRPERWGVALQRWLENVRDWNISRQLWWGHKIPLEGVDDVLDTWFSSALWPFATLGWPEKTPDMDQYYPTQFITSDRGILFLWQARMIFSGKFFTGKAPFSDLYIHATVLTKDGKRMSKSLGTGVDPLVLIEKYGADALRFGLAYQTTLGQDMKFGEDTSLMGKKFANKLWNIARYVLGKVGDVQPYLKSTSVSSNWTTKIDALATAVTAHVESYQFGEAAHALYDFVWHDIADTYIEETKNRDDEETKKTLVYLLLTSLKLLHPFMPFVTEELWGRIHGTDDPATMLVVQAWPR